MKLYLLDPFALHHGAAVGQTRLQVPVWNRNVSGSVVEATGKVIPLVLGPLDTYVSVSYRVRVGVTNER